jgi:hypothetical protein
MTEMDCPVMLLLLVYEVEVDFSSRYSLATPGSCSVRDSLLRVDFALFTNERQLKSIDSVVVARTATVLERALFGCRPNPLPLLIFKHHDTKDRLPEIGLDYRFIAPLLQTKQHYKRTLVNLVRRAQKRVTKSDLGIGA